MLDRSLSRTCGGRHPDVVTLNEVCESDVDALTGAVAASRDGGAVVSRFEPVVDVRTGQAVRRSGGRYGIARLARGPSGSGWRTTSGRYPVQDGQQAEQRAWLCLTDPGRLTVCTTHLASGSPAFTLAQCRYLLGSVVPALAADDDAPVVVSGDLNLLRTTSFGLRPCLQRQSSAVSADADDGVQHVLAGRDAGRRHAHGQHAQHHRPPGPRGCAVGPALAPIFA